MSEEDDNLTFLTTLYRTYEAMVGCVRPYYPDLLPNLEPSGAEFLAAIAANSSSHH